MRSKVLLYFLSVGMISGWAVNDSNAMNMQNLRPRPSRQQAKPTMPTMPSVQQAKPTMPSMPQVKQPEVTKPLTAEDRFKQRIREMMKSGSTELVIDEDYLGLKSEQCRTYEQGYQNNRFGIKSIDDAAVASYIRNNVKTLVVNSETINIAIEKMISNSEDQEEQNRQRFARQYLDGQQTSYDQLLQQELERRQSYLNTKYNKYPLWFGALEHVILCNGATINVCKTNLKDRYDLTVKGGSIDLNSYFFRCNSNGRPAGLTKPGFERILFEKGVITIEKECPGMRRLYWYPTFGKYDVKDRSLELASADEVKLLTDTIQTITGQAYTMNGMDISYMFSKITFPKNAEIDARVFDVCNTIAIDCQSTKFLWIGNYNDSTKEQKNIIMNGVQLITSDIKQRITECILSGGMDFYKRQSIRAIDPRFEQYWTYPKSREKINITWPGVTVLEKPDFTADDALLLARKAKLNVSDEIYIKEGIKWIGANSFSSSTKLPHNCFFNVTIPDSVIDIDQGAFSNGYIQDVIVRSERVKKLVQESGFQKNIIVDANPKKRNRTEASKTGASKPKSKHEVSKPGNQQNEPMESKRKISVLERRLMDTEEKLSTTKKKLTNKEQELAETKEALADATKKIKELESKIKQLEEEGYRTEAYYCDDCGYISHHSKSPDLPPVTEPTPPDELVDYYDLYYN